MTRYIVDVKEVWDYTVEVELPDDATKKQITDAANRAVSDGEEGTLEYNRTLDTEQWTVRTAEGKYL